VPHTFFDAYFSGRYVQDVCDDGSIFVDRDGEHFEHVLEYMRDGVVSVADQEERPSLGLLRRLQREFDYYNFELYAEQAGGGGHVELFGDMLAVARRSDGQKPEEEEEPRESAEAEEQEEDRKQM
jgi:hypothetical protein